MNLKKLTIAPMLALALLAVGCGEDEEKPTCESVCEDKKSCPDASEDVMELDCAAACGEEMKSFNESIGCQDEYDALVQCGIGLSDVCDEEACAAEGDAYGTCASECLLNPDACM